MKLTPYKTLLTMSKEAINVTTNALNRLASFMARDQLALAAHSDEAVAARMRSDGLDVLTLAKNARTSVEMLERFYLRHLQPELAIDKLHSRRKKRRHPPLRHR